MKKILGLIAGVGCCGLPTAFAGTPPVQAWGQEHCSMVTALTCVQAADQSIAVEFGDVRIRFFKQGLTEVSCTSAQGAETVSTDEVEAPTCISAQGLRADALPQPSGVEGVLADGTGLSYHISVVTTPLDGSPRIVSVSVVL